MRPLVLLATALCAIPMAAAFHCTGCPDGFDPVQNNVIAPTVCEQCLCQAHELLDDATGTCISCPCGQKCNGTNLATPCTGALSYSPLGASNCQNCPAQMVPTVDRCGCIHNCTCADAHWDESIQACRCDDVTKLYVKGEPDTCVACPCGRSCDGTTVSTPCPSGTYAEYGWGFCTACPDGQSPNADRCGCTIDCGPQAHLVNGRCVCIDTTKQYNALTRTCDACPCGYSCDGTEYTQMCPANTYGINGRCINCPTGQTSSAGACQCSSVCPSGTHYVNGACICDNTLLYYDPIGLCCQQCPCGSSCNGSQIITPCSGNTYAPYGAGRCQSCPSGQLPSDDKCSCYTPIPTCNCNAAVYDQVRQQCVCSAGYYYTTGPNCCQPCPCGYACDGTTLRSPCSTGQYSPSGSSVCQTCPAGSTVSSDRCSCTSICPAGTTYYQGSCICDDRTKLYNPQTRTCGLCPCGRSCDGSSNSYQCPYNTYAASGAGVCSQCPTGQEPDASQCTCVAKIPECGPGAVYNTVLGYCVCTDTRRYYNTLTQTCDLCPCGSSCNGSPYFTECPANTYAALGSGICSSCPTNQQPSADRCSCVVYCGPEAEYVTELGICVCRNREFYFVDATRECQPCPCGRICNGTTVISPCPTGTYSPLGAADCCECPTGQVPSADRCGCVIPAAVTCNTPDAEYVEGVGCVCRNKKYYYSCETYQCLPCPCGNVCDGSSNTERCPEGYIAAAGSNQCIACSGSTVPSEDRCTCVSTPPVHDCGCAEAYFDTTLQTCVCYDNKRYFVPATTTTGAYCAACPCGRSCTGTSVTTPCPDGYYAAAGAGVCTACLVGTTPSADKCECTPLVYCPNGSTLINGQCVCTNRLQYFDTALQQCVQCPCGYACDGTSYRSLCPEGYYSTLGSGVCSACSTGVSSTDRCQCIGGTVCGTGATEINGVCTCINRLQLYVPAQLACASCPAGYSCDGTAVSYICPANTVAAAGAGVCTTCPIGTVPNANRSACVSAIDDCGSSASLQNGVCICSNTNMLYNSATKTCVACPAGSYCNGGTTALPCPTGQYAPVGAGFCTPCPNDQIPNIDASACVANEGLGSFARIIGSVAAVLAGVLAL